MIRVAHDAGSLTTPSLFGAEQSTAIAAAGEGVAVAVKPDIIVLCHGGPIVEPDDAQHVIDHPTGSAGFFVTSSMERLPTEIATTENMRYFTRISRHEAAAS